MNKSHSNDILPNVSPSICIEQGESLLYPIIDTDSTCKYNPCLRETEETCTTSGCQWTADYLNSIGWSSTAELFADLNNGLCYPTGPTQSCSELEGLLGFCPFGTSNAAVNSRCLSLPPGSSGNSTGGNTVNSRCISIVDYCKETRNARICPQNGTNLSRCFQHAYYPDCYGSKDQYHNSCEWGGCELPNESPSAQSGYGVRKQCCNIRKACSMFTSENCPQDGDFPYISCTPFKQGCVWGISNVSLQQCLEEEESYLYPVINITDTGAKCGYNPCLYRSSEEDCTSGPEGDNCQWTSNFQSEFSLTRQRMIANIFATNGQGLCYPKGRSQSCVELNSVIGVCPSYSPHSTAYNTAENVCVALPEGRCVDRDFCAALVLPNIELCPLGDGRLSRCFAYPSPAQCVAGHDQAYSDCEWRRCELNSALNLNGVEGEQYECCNPTKRCNLFTGEKCLADAETFGLSCFVLDNTCMSIYDCVALGEDYFFPNIIESLSSSLSFPLSSSLSSSATCVNNTCLAQTDQMSCTNRDSSCVWTEDYTQISYITSSPTRLALAQEFAVNSGQLCYPSLNELNCTALQRLTGNCSEFAGCYEIYISESFKMCVDKTVGCDKKICPRTEFAASTCFYTAQYENQRCYARTDNYGPCVYDSHCPLASINSSLTSCCHPAPTCEMFSAADCLSVAVTIRELDCFVFQDNCVPVSNCTNLGADYLYPMIVLSESTGRPVCANSTCLTQQSSGACEKSGGDVYNCVWTDDYTGVAFVNDVSTRKAIAEEYSLEENHLCYPSFDGLNCSELYRLTGLCDSYSECFAVPLSPSSLLCADRIRGCNLTVCPQSTSPFSPSACFILSATQCPLVGGCVYNDAHCPLAIYDETVTQCCHQIPRCDMFSAQDCMTKAVGENGLSCFVFGGLCQNITACANLGEEHFFPVIKSNPNPNANFPVCANSSCFSYETSGECFSNTCVWTEDYMTVVDITGNRAALAHELADTNRQLCYPQAFRTEDSMSCAELQRLTGGCADVPYCIEISLSRTAKVCLEKNLGCNKSVCLGDIPSECFNTQGYSFCYRSSSQGLNCVYDEKCPLQNHDPSLTTCCHPQLECRYFSEADCLSDAALYGLNCYVGNHKCTSIDIASLSPRSCVDNQTYIYPILGTGNKCTYNPCLSLSKDACLTSPGSSGCEWTENYNNWFYKEPQREIAEMFRSEGNGLCYPQKPAQNCSVVKEKLDDCNIYRCMTLPGGECVEAFQCDVTAPDYSLCPDGSGRLSNCFQNSNEEECLIIVNNSECVWGGCKLDGIAGECCNPKRVCLSFTANECPIEHNPPCLVQDGKCIDDPCYLRSSSKCTDSSNCVYNIITDSCSAHPCSHNSKETCENDVNWNCEYSDCRDKSFAYNDNCCQPVESVFNCSGLAQTDCQKMGSRICMFQGGVCMNNPCAGKNVKECQGECFYDNVYGCRIDPCFAKTTSAACTLDPTCEYTSACPYDSVLGSDSPCCIPFNCSTLSLATPCNAHPACIFLGDRCVQNKCGKYSTSPTDCFLNSGCLLTPDGADFRCEYSFFNSSQNCTFLLSENECDNYFPICEYPDQSFGCIQAPCRASTIYGTCMDSEFCAYDEVSQLCRLDVCDDISSSETNVCPSSCDLVYMKSLPGGSYDYVTRDVCMNPRPFSCSSLSNNIAKCAAHELCHPYGNTRISSDRIYEYSSCHTGVCHTANSDSFTCPGVYCDVSTDDPSVCTDSACFRALNEVQCDGLSEKCVWGLCQGTEFTENFVDAEGKCCYPRLIHTCDEITDSTLCNAHQGCLYFSGSCHVDICKEFSPSECLRSQFGGSFCTLDLNNKCIHHSCTESLDETSCTVTSPSDERTCSWGYCVSLPYMRDSTNSSLDYNCCMPSNIFDDSDPDWICRNHNTSGECNASPYCVYNYQISKCKFSNLECLNLSKNDCWKNQSCVYDESTEMCIISPCFGIPNPSVDVCSAGSNNIPCTYGPCQLASNRYTGYTADYWCCNAVPFGRMCSSCAGDGCYSVDASPGDRYYQKCFRDGCPPGFNLVVGDSKRCVRSRLGRCGDFSQEECNTNSSCKWASKGGQDSEGECKNENFFLCMDYGLQSECEADTQRDGLGCAWLRVDEGAEDAMPGYACRSISQATTCEIFRNEELCEMPGKFSLVCGWKDGQCSYLGCTDREYAPSSNVSEHPCGIGCVTQNHECMEECGNGFDLNPKHPGYCIIHNAKVIEEGSVCDGTKSCLERAFDDLMGESLDMYAIVIFASTLDLLFSPVIDFGNFALEGVSSSQTTLRIDANTQIKFVSTQSASVFSVAGLTLGRYERAELPMISLTGGSFSLRGVSVQYSYPVITTFNRIALQGFMNQMDACVQQTEYPAILVSGGTQNFEDVVFTDIDTGAITVANSVTTFERVSFIRNTIGADTDTGIRHNAFFENSTVTVLNGVNSDVVTDTVHNLFFTADLTDNSTFIIASTENDVSILYSPTASKFEIKEGRGAFTGTFITCTFTLKIYLNGNPVLLDLPLTVESTTLATFSLPDGALQKSGNYDFQFLYKVGTKFTGNSAKFSLYTVPEPNDSPNTIIIVVIVVVVVVVVLAVVTTILTTVVLYKKKLGCFKGQKIEVINSVDMIPTTETVSTSSIATENDDRSKQEQSHEEPAFTLTSEPDNVDI